MDTVVRALFIYGFLLVVFRAAGKRSMADITNFDLVLTLIISEAVQQALIIDDYSVTNAVVLVSTLVAVDVALSVLKQRVPGLEKYLDGLPTVIIREGHALRAYMAKERIDEQDVLEAARRWRGLERMEQIRYAVVEVNGGITVVPKTRSD